MHIYFLESESLLGIRILESFFRRLTGCWFKQEREKEALELKKAGNDHFKKQGSKRFHECNAICRFTTNNKLTLTNFMVSFQLNLL